MKYATTTVNTGKEGRSANDSTEVRVKVERIENPNGYPEVVVAAAQRFIGREMQEIRQTYPRGVNMIGRISYREYYVLITIPQKPIEFYSPELGTKVIQESTWRFLDIFTVDGLPE
jgi:hypothetical protein